MMHAIGAQREREITMLGDFLACGLWKGTAVKVEAENFLMCKSSRSTASRMKGADCLAVKACLAVYVLPHGTCEKCHE